jgi:PleD family two-component response regulator
LTVTASFGVAELTLESQDSSDTLLGRADRALYASKRYGRNRVTVSAESFHTDLHAGD